MGEDSEEQMKLIPWPRELRHEVEGRVEEQFFSGATRGGVGEVRGTSGEDVGAP